MRCGLLCNSIGFGYVRDSNACTVATARSLSQVHGSQDALRMHWTKCVLLSLRPSSQVTHTETRIKKERERLKKTKTIQDKQLYIVSFPKKQRPPAHGPSLGWPGMASPGPAWRRAQRWLLSLLSPQPFGCGGSFYMVEVDGGGYGNFCFWMVNPWPLQGFVARKVPAKKNRYLNRQV